MKVLILAAGMGKRLRPITDKIPKTLIELQGVPILGHILKNVKACKLKDVVVITGYRENTIRDYIYNFNNGLNIECVNNKLYNKTENILSVQMAEEYLSGESFILVNADNVFSPVILYNLAKSKGDIVLSVDHATVGSEEMKVMVNNGYITRVSKLLDPDRSFGEDIGVIKFTPSGGRSFFNSIDGIISSEGPKYYYQEALDRLSINYYPMKYIDISGEPWIEIDDHFDLKQARAQTILMVMERFRALRNMIKRKIRRK